MVEDEEGAGGVIFLNFVPVSSYHFMELYNVFVVVLVVIGFLLIFVKFFYGGRRSKK